MLVHDALDGWRIWYTRPAEATLTLYSPIYGTDLQRVRPSTCRTTGKLMRATCALRAHQPPAPGCACGIYAVTNVVDAIYRLRAMAANIRRADTYNCWFPLNPDRGMVPVLAQVKLRQAVEHDDKGTWSILSQVKQQIKVSTPVIRAATAEITHMYITDDLIGPEAADNLAQHLTASFDVKTDRSLPPYTTQDWDSRPEWMRTEPWRTQNVVDSTLGTLISAPGSVTSC